MPMIQPVRATTAGDFSAQARSVGLQGGDVGDLAVGRRQQIRGDGLHADVEHMAVRVDEPGEQRLAAQIHDLSRIALELQNLGLVADGEYLAVLHRDARLPSAGHR